MDYLSITGQAINNIASNFSKYNSSSGMSGNINPDAAASIIGLLIGFFIMFIFIFFIDIR